MAGSRLLVLDVGNTNIVLGVYDGEVLEFSVRLATSQQRTVDEYGILARQLLPIDTTTLAGAIVASVVPPLNGTIRSMVERYFGVTPLFVEAGVKTGLAITTENPLEVGADRIVNAVAAHYTYGGPGIVVDFGTATTFDVVSANAEYRGGLIAPGLMISAEALFSRAARLPRVDIRRPQHLIGTSTTTSMQSGIYYGYRALVTGILAQLRDEVRDLKYIVATGTLASLIAEDLPAIDVVDYDLTLKGLKIVWDRNRKIRPNRGGGGRQEHP